MMRTDAAIARLSSLVCVAAGIRDKSTNEAPTVRELMPWADEPELSVDQAMREWK